MRKLIYILSILGLGGILVYQGFFHMTTKPTETLGDFDFSSTPVMKLLQESGDNVTEKNITPSESGSLSPDSVIFDKLGAFDGVYHIGSSSLDIDQKNKNAPIITLGEGEYILAINSLFSEYTILGSGFKITPKTPGYFYVQNYASHPRIYSFNSILDIALLSEKKLITNFELFPSLLFLYDPLYNKNIEKADILRVATVNNIQYVGGDSTPELGTIIGQSPDIKKSSALLSLSKKHISHSLKQYKLLLADLLKNRPENLNGADFIDKYPFLFINDSKKDIFLKNRLVQGLANVIESSSSKNYNGNSQELDALVGEILSASEKTKTEASDTIKIYAELAFLNPQIESLGDQSAIKVSPFLNLLEKMNVSKGKNASILPLSELFLLKQFMKDGLYEKDVFEKSLNSYLKNILATPASIQSEYPYFAFFLSQYLSNADNLGQYTFSIGTHFITISNANLTNAPKNAVAQKVLLETAVLNYDKICDQIIEVIKRTFFVQSEKGLVLKDTYLEDGRIKQDIIDLQSLKDFITYLSRDIAEKQKLYIPQQGGSKRDVFVSVNESIQSLSHLSDIFNDYSNYLEKLELDPLNQSATRLTDSSVGELSRESLVAYLSQFNGVDTSTLTITNNYRGDGFYQVRVNILNYIFNFKLQPSGNVIEDVTVADNNGQTIKTITQSISLDDREKWLQDINMATSDPIKKYQTDFKNFFEINYLSNNSQAPVADSSSQGTGKEMTAQMKIFVQKNLLGDGDFKILGDFLPILANNIYATISDGQYKVELSKIPKMFSNNNEDYLTEMDGFYVFAKHSFYKLSLTVKDKNAGYQFGGYGVDILPAFIPIQEASKILSPIGKYLSVLEKNYTSGAKTLKIDLNSHTVSIDSVSFPVTY